MNAEKFTKYSPRIICLGIHVHRPGIIFSMHTFSPLGLAFPFLAIPCGPSIANADTASPPDVGIWWRPGFLTLCSQDSQLDRFFYVTPTPCPPD